MIEAPPHLHFFFSLPILLHVGFTISSDRPWLCADFNPRQSWAGTATESALREETSPTEKCTPPSKLATVDMCEWNIFCTRIKADFNNLRLHFCEVKTGCTAQWALKEMGCIWGFLGEKWQLARRNCVKTREETASSRHLSPLVELAAGGRDEADENSPNLAKRKRTFLLMAEQKQAKKQSDRKGDNSRVNLGASVVWLPVATAPCQSRSVVKVYSSCDKTYSALIGTWRYLKKRKCTKSCSIMQLNHSSVCVGTRIVSMVTAKHLPSQILFRIPIRTVIETWFLEDKRRHVRTDDE